MNIVSGFNPKIINDIAKSSGANSVKNAVTYLRVPAFRGGGKFKCEVIDEVAFFAGMICKNHFRLYETAVKKEAQGKGYGTIIINRIKTICKKHCLSKITFRTSKEEKAVDFYRHFGATIIGTKDNDYEMEIRV